MNPTTMYNYNALKNKFKKHFLLIKSVVLNPQVLVPGPEILGSAELGPEAACMTLR